MPAAEAEPNPKPPVVRKRFSSGDVLMLVAITALVLAVAYPAYLKYRTRSVDSAVEANLARIQAAAEQYYLERAATSVPLNELVGPGRPLPAIEPVARESYPVVLRQGEALVATGVEGSRSVTYGGLPSSVGAAPSARLITAISPADLARLVSAARARVPEPLLPVTAADVARMPTSYQWGAGAGQRLWRRIDNGMWHEVYPDGRYSQFPILGRAIVNGQPGVIAVKDDGHFDVFIPDKGGRMFHQLRASGGGGAFSDYMPMENVR